MTKSVYKYKANGNEAYNSLAAFAVTLPVTVTLFPEFKTIVAPEDAADAIGNFIEEEGTNVEIIVVEIDNRSDEDLLSDPTSDNETLRVTALGALSELAAAKRAYDDKLNQTVNERDKALDQLRVTEREREDNYKRWFNAHRENNRVRAQVEAISTLMKSIYSTNPIT